MNRMSAPTHETLAADQYWLPPTYVPNEPRLIEGLSTDFKLTRDKATLSEIAELVLDMSGGVAVEAIEDGREIPIPPPDSKQVIKVIHDTRTIFTWDLRR